MAKATKTVKQQLCYKRAHAPYFTATKVLFNQVAAFYFEVFVAHRGILELSSKEALTALETLSGKASSSSGTREARENGRCSPFPRRQRQWKAIYQPCQAWISERAGHRAGYTPWDG